MNFLFPNEDLTSLRYGWVEIPEGEFCGVWSTRDVFFLSTGTKGILKKALKYCPWLSLFPCLESNSQETQELKKCLRSFFGGGKNLLRPNANGTLFQMKVWRALLAIPRGQTRSYGELARKIGAPKACRAVGTACGKNPVAFLIPCHRVIQSSGGLGGFGLSLPLKKQLLQVEGAI
ncbi:MAG: methylated-DNA--[protein]-cysteine S-methyltransferase [Gemmataceae bacterium]|nr:methylated-DNA--[protein]-cysteine S-methyltransferase [Gemmataceae bacterium]